MVANTRIVTARAGLAIVSRRAINNPKPTPVNKKKKKKKSIIETSAPLPIVPITVPLNVPPAIKAAHFDFKKFVNFN